MHVPICVPSAEQTVSPGIVHKAVCALLGVAAEGATEVATADALDGASGVLELSESAVAAAAEGTAAASSSCRDIVGKAVEGIAAATDDEGCTIDDTLDCVLALSLSPDPPATVQPIGVH